MRKSTAFRSEDGGTRSFRFSYSNPPLQQMPSRDEELAPLIRGVFLPEEGEVWAKPDVSQQEFRFIVHYAVTHGLRKAKEAAERYRTDPDADFHQLVADLTGLDRRSAKGRQLRQDCSARACASSRQMIGKPEDEARAIYDRYDRELPFVRQLAVRCQSAAAKQGYLELYDGARRHWDAWEAPEIAWTKGTGPCSREEAERRVRDPDHPWYRRWIRRAETHKAMNALIQGSAARHTKLWMRACWREGIVPLLQMHDALDCSVASPKQARAGRAAGTRGRHARSADAGRPEVWPAAGATPNIPGKSFTGPRRPQPRSAAQPQGGDLRVRSPSPNSEPERQRVGT